MGGMVLGSNLGGCYCPFDNSFLSLSSSSSICQNPLPKCSTCFTCHSDCLNCFGSNQNQCTSCISDFDFVSSINSDGFFPSFYFFFFLFIYFGGGEQITNNKINNRKCKNRRM